MNERNELGGPHAIQQFNFDLISALPNGRNQSKWMLTADAAPREWMNEIWLWNQIECFHFPRRGWLPFLLFLFNSAKQFNQNVWLIAAEWRKERKNGPAHQAQQQQSIFNWIVGLLAWASQLAFIHQLHFIALIHSFTAIIKKRLIFSSLFFFIN